MNSTALFNMVLGLQAPWQVHDISFAAEASSHEELHRHVGLRVVRANRHGSYGVPGARYGGT